MSEAQISVIVPTYNRVLLLERCLESFSKQTFPRENFEVIVIDDGSSDSTKALLKERSFPFQVHSIFQNHGGAARARNEGIVRATGKILVFTDDDCIASPEFLAHHWQAHDKGKECVARGPILLVRSFQETLRVKPSFFSFSMNFFCTSNASVSRTKLLEVGKFNEAFERWEDAELGFRLRKSGLKMIFMPKAVVHHLKPMWRLADLIRTAKSDGKSARQLFKWHPSFRTWMSSGLHPLSLGIGYGLKGWVDRKILKMERDAFVDGLDARMIFHRFFVEGLRESK